MDNSQVGLRYIGKQTANIDYHHGQLASIKGVSHFQVFRANRSHPQFTDEHGWTFNHSPLMAFWRGKFYLQYVSYPVSENTPPCRTMLVTSANGMSWGSPEILFPAYEILQNVYRGSVEILSDSQAVMHQRMGFYVSKDGRLLALGFYGISPNPFVFPNDGNGIGRVVREIYEDGSFGPIYFIRFNRHAGWNEDNTLYPFYSLSSDSAFKQACEEILTNKLVTAQWWEEDRSKDGFYSIEGNKALSYYHLADGRVVGLWKWSKVSISSDEGATWLPAEEAESLLMAGGKVWGQKTPLGSFVLIYNPSIDNVHRWPLALITSEDGLLFDNLLLVNGEVPPRRYAGMHKYFGLNYVSGIAEGNGTPPDSAIWICYSVNKEDIWVSRIPLPIMHKETEAVHELFDDAEVDSPIKNWQIYSTLLSTISVANVSVDNDRSLKFAHSDPYDYAKAERSFPESVEASIDFRFQADLAGPERIEIEVTDAESRIALRLLLDSNGYMKVRHGGGTQCLMKYRSASCHDVHIKVNTIIKKFDIIVTGETQLLGLHLLMPVFSVEKILFRTSRLRVEPTHDTELESEDLPDADKPLEESRFYLHELRIQSNAKVE